MTDDAVIRAFLAHTSGSSKQLSSTGERLSLHWPSATIAEWVDGKLRLGHPYGNVSQKYIKRVAKLGPAYLLTADSWWALPAKTVKLLKQEGRGNPALLPTRGNPPSQGAVKAGVLQLALAKEVAAHFPGATVEGTPITEVVKKRGFFRPDAYSLSSYLCLRYRGPEEDRARIERAKDWLRERGFRDFREESGMSYSDTPYTLLYASFPKGTQRDLANPRKKLPTRRNHWLLPLAVGVPTGYVAGMVAQKRYRVLGNPRGNPRGFKSFVVDFDVRAPGTAATAKRIIERWEGKKKFAHAGYLSASFASEDDAKHAMSAAAGMAIPSSGVEKPSNRMLAAFPQQKARKNPKRKALREGIVEVSYAGKHNRSWKLRGPAGDDTPAEVYNKIGSGMWSSNWTRLDNLRGFPSNIGPADWNKLVREWDKARYQ